MKGPVMNEHMKRTNFMKYTARILMAASVLCLAMPGMADNCTPGTPVTQTVAVGGIQKSYLPTPWIWGLVEMI